MILNKLYLVIIKRKLKHRMDISKFMAPDPLGHYAFLHRTNTFGEWNWLLLNFKKYRTWKADIAEI